jgi:hypothetical protein
MRLMLLVLLLLLLMLLLCSLLWKARAWRRGRSEGWIGVAAAAAAALAAPE